MISARPTVRVLALNSGSSSLKFGVYETGAQGADVRLSGEAESIGDAAGHFTARDSDGNVVVAEAGSFPSQRDAMVRIERYLADCKMRPPDIVGHRIVHGGPLLRQHCLIDDAVFEQLDTATAFAPLHTLAALAVVRFAREQYPGLLQVACFDTTFHAEMPDVARVLPIARELQAEGIRRYGFHGLSCESIVHQLATDLPNRLIIAHLGNGASVTAVKNGKSIDTSMGMTPTGGVMMGSRSGDLDPGVLVYLMREKQYDGSRIEELVDRRSGLLGISGVAGDMRRLHQAAPSNPSARLAIQMFCYSARKQIAAMIAALDGVETVVFTGGIGENDGNVRATICDGLSWAGVRVDDARNSSATNPISGPGSGVSVLVLPSKEDEQIARHAWALFPHAVS